MYKGGICTGIEKKKVKRGFTLIELVAVISIILILAGFLVPRYIAYENKAKSVKAINTAKQINSALLSSYSIQGGKIVTLDMLDTIKSVTGIGETTGDIDMSSTDGKSVIINFKCDDKSYLLTSIPESSSYTVNYGESEIFKSSK